MLANPEIVRERIKLIRDTELRILFMTIFVFGMRIGEALTIKYESDTKANPTGKHLKLTKQIFQIDPSENFDFQTLAFSKFRELGRALTYEEILKIKEEVMVLEIKLEKRKGTIYRRTAVPLNVKYEPFAKEIYNYLTEHVDSNGSCGFPIYRQTAHYYAKKYFDDLDYRIEPYQKVRVGDNGKFLTRTDEYGRVKFEYDIVDTHLRDFANHGCRHMRTDELKNKFRIVGKELDTFIGWVAARGHGDGGAMQDRYAQNAWRMYMPKLIVKRF